MYDAEESQFSSSLKERYNFDNYLNGIVQVGSSDQFLVTGKNWGAMYQVKFDF